MERPIIKRAIKSNEKSKLNIDNIRGAKKITEIIIVNITSLNHVAYSKLITRRKKIEATAIDSATSGRSAGADGHCV